MLIGPFLPFLLAVGLAVDVDDLDLVNEAVDERDDASRVRKHFIPPLEATVGCQDDGFFLISPRNDFKEEIRVLA